MFTRTFNVCLALALSLAGCSRSDSDGARGQTAADKLPPDQRVWCRTAGQAEPAPVCAAEQSGQLLTLRDAAGGFRRFRIVSDGRGLVAADGASPAHVTILSPREIEIKVDGSLYRLPARMTSGAE